MKVDWDEIRAEQFPALKNSIYLKAAGGSPMCKSAYDAALKYYDEMYHIGDTFWDQYFDDLRITRRLIAEYLNAKPSDIAFLINTSAGMNVIAHMIEKGDIIYPEGEFPSSILIFKLLGYNCIPIKVQPDNTYSLEKFFGNNRINAKYLIHSHIQYLTGFKQNLDLLGSYSTKYDFVNIINATQSFGAFPIDVQNQKIDMLVASGLKWACSGYGVGVLYINNKHLPKNNLPFSSWLSIRNAFSMNNENLDLIKETKSMDGLGGTPNFPSLFTLKGSMTLIKTIGNGNIQSGISKIQKRIKILTDEFVEKINNIGFKIISPLEPRYRSGIITIESAKAESIFYHLLSKNIQVSLRNYPRLKKKTLIRFAFNYYNNFDDINKTIEVLKQIKEV